MTENEPPSSSVRSTARFKRVRVLSACGEWRTLIRSSNSMFDERAKEIFLEQYRQHGRIGDSAHCAGVSISSVRHHMTIDTEFAEACMEAEEEYRCKLIGHVQDLIFNGMEKKNYDRNGNMISSEITYPIKLIELEMKKHDKGYTDRKEIDIKLEGGVVIAPREVDSIEDWEDRFSAENLVDITPGLDKIDASSSVEMELPTTDKI